MSLTVFVLTAYIFTTSGYFLMRKKPIYGIKCQQPDSDVLKTCIRSCQEPAFCVPYSYRNIECYRCNWNDGIDRKGECGGIVYKGQCKYRRGFNHVMDAINNCKDGRYNDKVYKYKSVKLEFQFSCYYCVHGLKCNNDTI